MRVLVCTFLLLWGAVFGGGSYASELCQKMPAYDEPKVKSEHIKTITEIFTPNIHEKVLQSFTPKWQVMYGRSINNRNALQKVFSFLKSMLSKDFVRVEELKQRYFDHERKLACLRIRKISTTDDVTEYELSSFECAYNGLLCGPVSAGRAKDRLMDQRIDLALEVARTRFGVFVEGMTRREWLLDDRGFRDIQVVTVLNQSTLKPEVKPTDGRDVIALHDISRDAVFDRSKRAPGIIYLWFDRTTLKYHEFEHGQLVVND